MNTSDILKHIDGVYSKVKKKLITNKSLENPSFHTIQEFTQKNIEKIKSVGIKETLLTLGTPEEKTVLYKEVIKREKEEAKELSNHEKKVRKAQKEKNKNTKLTKSKSVTKTKPTNEEPHSKAPSKKKTTKTTRITKEVAKKKTVSKTSTKTKSSKRDEKIALYIQDIKKHYGEVDEAFVAIIVKNLGPSIYRKNAELVSCSDPKELDTVRRNFLMKKLSIDASKEVLDTAIQDVCKELKDVDTKYRATFYYALAKKFKKESILS